MFNFSAALLLLYFTSFKTFMMVSYSAFSEAAFRSVGSATTVCSGIPGQKIEHSIS
jgi:hypothetical protein